MSYPSLSMYISKKFDNEIADRISEYANENKEEIIDNWERALPKYRDIIDSFEFDCLQEVINIHIGNRPDDSLIFTLQMNTDFDVQLNNREHEEITLHQWFYIECQGNLATDFADFQILSVSLGQGRMPTYEHPMSDELVPIIGHKDVENEAMGFILHNCPVILRKKIAIDPYEVADKLGLRIQLSSEMDDKNFGQIFFRDTHTTDGTIIQGNTIYVNQKSFLFGTYGNLTFTIIHECIHWWLHRKMFMLRQLCGKQENAVLYCKTDGSVDFKIQLNIKEKADIARMEWQANSIAAAAIMPQKIFREAVQNYIDVFKNGELQGRPLCDVINSFLPLLKEQFRTSAVAARRRMIDLGFEEAVGSGEYVDNHYLRPYQFPRGFLKKNETFTIEFVDAAIMNFADPSFHELLQTGQYLFVDNHFVYNDPAYIEKAVDGSLQLTDYGRLHMDECCLVFNKTFKREGKDEDTRFDTVLFYNKQSGLVYTTKVTGNPKDIQEQSKKLKEVLEHVNATTSFAEALSVLIDEWCGEDDNPAVIKDQNQIAYSAGVQPSYISELRKGKTRRPSITTVLKLSFAMGLPPILCEAFQEKGQCRIKDIPDINQKIAYQLAADSLYCGSVAKINDTFKALGLPLLEIQDEDTKKDN